MNRLAFLRYKSRLRPAASQPMSFQIMDMEAKGEHDTIFWVLCREQPKRGPRRYLVFHLDHINRMVWVFTPGACGRYLPTSEHRCPVGIFGEIHWV